MSTTNGYRIFDVRNFEEITDYNKTIYNLGDLNIAIPYYRSKLIFFSGTKNNSKYPQNILYLWDDFALKILGKIILNDFEIVLNIFHSFKILFIVLDLKILVFSIEDLKLISVLEDIYSSDLISSSKLYNPAIIAYVSNLNTSYIKIDKFLYDPKANKFKNFNSATYNNINSTSSISFNTNNIFENNDNEFIDWNIKSHQMNLVTGFKEIDYIKISSFGEYICVVGEGANRFHLYSLFDYELKYCLWRGAKPSHTIDISFDLKCKFMSILTGMKTLHIYKLFDDNNKSHHNYINKKILENATMNRMSLQTLYGDFPFYEQKESVLMKIKVFCLFIFFNLFYILSGLLEGIMNIVL